MEMSLQGELRVSFSSSFSFKGAKGLNGQSMYSVSPHNC